jgi:glycosyltransferase involved in cell wall biosynthesis
VRVAFDAGPLLDPPTGVGRYTRELGTALELQGIELTYYAVALRGRAGVPISRWRLPARAMRGLWHRFGGPAIERLVGAVDLVHATNFVLPALRSTPGVVTVHDLSFYRDDTFSGGKRLRALVPWSVGRAALVIVPSAAVGEEVRGRFGLDRDRIAITPEGVSPLFFGATPLSDEALARMGVGRPFALAVGTIEPRKNLAALLQAWERTRDRLGRRRWTLVLAGPSGWGPRLPRTEGVVPVGWVGDETLPGLLAAAEVFCYPSLYEGFGLPPLEAMAAGTPVVAATYTAASEVLGDAALLVDPTDSPALADAVVAAATDHALRSSLVVAGRARASAYTWEAAARATIAAYESVFKENDRRVE